MQPRYLMRAVGSEIILKPLFSPLTIRPLSEYQEIRNVLFSVLPLFRRRGKVVLFLRQALRPSPASSETWLHEDGGKHMANSRRPRGGQSYNGFDLRLMEWTKCPSS